LRGTASTGEPWKIDGKAAYSLRAGEKQLLRLRIAPLAAQDAHGEVTYSSDPGQKTILSAVAEAALAITPEKLYLQPGPDGSRAGLLTIANRTSEEVPVRLRIGGWLKGPERAVLPAGGTLSVKIVADNTWMGPIDGAVQVESPSFVADIGVHAAALGPVLRVTPSSLALGKLDGPRQPGKMVSITNAGGTGTFVRVAPSSHVFLATGDSSFWLEAGSSRNVAVSVEPPEAGSYHERLTIKSDAGDLEIPVTAEAAHGRTKVVIVSAPKHFATLFESLDIAEPAPQAAAMEFGVIQIKKVTDT